MRNLDPSAVTSNPRPFAGDNGVPFKTQGIHGLSYLNVWWQRLGIHHQRSPPRLPAGQRGP